MSATTGDVALFFGLSGTGKTTLSADPYRTLIGDDEHGWSDDGVFNFEGGCYAKTIRLSREAEPEIYATTERFGTVLENVVLDPSTRLPDFDDGSLTENARCAYPLHYIPNASPTGRAGDPKNVVMLTCDAFGVMPPIARLNPSQAMYHFLSGYTAKVAGTETGVTEPEATFSTCFGAPFMPRHPTVYGNLLRDRIAAGGATCWLVNTGWTGGSYGAAGRMPIKVTRALLAAALDGSLNSAPMRVDPVFGFEVPSQVPGVDPAILDPRSTWSDPGRLRRPGCEARRDVPGELRQVRGACGRRRRRRPARAAYRGGVGPRHRARRNDDTFSPGFGARLSSSTRGSAGTWFSSCALKRDSSPGAVERSPRSQCGRPRERFIHGRHVPCVAPARDGNRRPAAGFR